MAVEVTSSLSTSSNKEPPQEVAGRRDLRKSRFGFGAGAFSYLRASALLLGMAAQSKAATPSFPPADPAAPSLNDDRLPAWQGYLNLGVATMAVLYAIGRRWQCEAREELFSSNFRNAKKELQREKEFAAPLGISIQERDIVITRRSALLAELVTKLAVEPNLTTQDICLFILRSLDFPRDTGTLEELIKSLRVEQVASLLLSLDTEKKSQSSIRESGQKVLTAAQQAELTATLLIQGREELFPCKACSYIRGPLVMDVAADLSNRPALGSEALKHLAASEHPEIRRVVAQRSDCQDNQEILIALLQDRDVEVAEAASVPLLVESASDELVFLGLRSPFANIQFRAAKLFDQPRLERNLSLVVDTLRSGLARASCELLLDRAYRYLDEDQLLKIASRISETDLLARISQHPKATQLVTGTVVKSVARGLRGSLPEGSQLQSAQFLSGQELGDNIPEVLDALASGLAQAPRQLLFDSSRDCLTEGHLLNLANRINDTELLSEINKHPKATPDVTEIVIKRAAEVIQGSVGFDRVCVREALPGSSYWNRYGYLVEEEPVKAIYEDRLNVEQAAAAAADLRRYFHDYIPQILGHMVDDKRLLSIKERL